MSIGMVPVVRIRSRDVFLKLTKSGPYSIKHFKKVTKKDVEEAIVQDEKLIKEIEEKLDEKKLERINKMMDQYSLIKDSESWKEIVNASKKISQFNYLKRNLENAMSDKETCDEMIETLNNYFAKKYLDVILSNEHYQFYKEREIILDECNMEFHYLSLIKHINEEIDSLKEYCDNNSNLFSSKRKI